MQQRKRVEEKPDEQKKLIFFVLIINIKAEI